MSLERKKQSRLKGPGNAPSGDAKAQTAQRVLVNATGDFCTLTLLKFFLPNKGHDFIFEYISYNNWLFSSNIFSQQV